MTALGGAMIYLGVIGLVVTSTVLDSSALDSTFILIIVVGVFVRVLRSTKIAHAGISTHFRVIRMTAERRPSL
jgi:uncharacterized membrane protein YobD (UPF0266 family)